MGTNLGASPSGAWGRFAVTVTQGLQDTVCVSCKRVRGSRRIGGIGVLGSYVEAGSLYVVASDVEKPATSFALRFSGPEVYEFPLQPVAGEPPSVVAEPLEQLDTPPAGAVLALQLLAAALPEVQASGTYQVSVIDQNTDTTIPIQDMELEANVQLLLPQHADLHGAPSLWLQDFNVDLASAYQPGGSPRCTIPFDRCTGVLEYDASAGSLPTGQGWSLVGSGSINDFGIVDARVLRMNTTVASYFEKSLTLAQDPGRVHGYIQYRRGVFDGRGLDLQALYATASAAYRGARVNARDAGPYKMKLDATSSSALGIAGRPAGWESLGGSQVTSGPGVAWRDDYAEDATSTYGTGATAGATEIRCRFGDTNGDGITGYIRHVVCSAPGRFIRAGFAGYADVADPTLRFGLSRLVDVDTDTTARFKVTYGQNANVYGAQQLTASFTATISAANSIIEFALKLSGILAQQPFWFTVERDWNHADDLFDATVYLHHVTVRPR